MSLGNIPEVFLDIDVSFDILSKRAPHFEESKKLLEAAIAGKIQLCISNISLPTLIYLGNDIYKIPDYTVLLKLFLGSVKLVETKGKKIVIEALDSTFKDKEDSLQYYTALSEKMDFFVTRNTKDYRYSESKLPVFTPQEFIQSLT